MANVKITDLTALSAADVASTDVLPIVDVNADQTKKIAISDLITATSAANDFITFTQLNANLNVLDANADAIESRRVANIAGAVSTITTGNLTASRALIAGSGGKVEVSDVTSTELAYLDGVSSAIQTQLDAKIATTDSASNDFVTFTRLNANVNVVSANAAGVETRRVANIAGGVSTITTSDLTADRAVISSGSGKVAVSAVTSTELGYLDGVSSAIQTQLDSKSGSTDAASNDFITFTRLNANVNVVSANAAGVETRRVANIAGGVSTITTSDLTADRAVISSGSGKVAVSAVTATEVGYLDGVTSAIQTQIDSKSSTSNATALAAEDVALQARITANNTLTSAVETRRTNNIAGAVSTITTGDLTASRAMATNGSGKVAVSAVTATELGYLDGVTSAIQTQIDSKQATITGAATTIDDADLTASRALVSGSGGKVEVSAVTATEVGYLDGVSSAIQTQLDAKAALAGATFSGQVNMSDDLVVTGNLTVNGDTTTVSSTNLDVEDRMIMLADGTSGSPSADVGLLFNRGNQGNAAIFYDESATTFKLSDTKDPKSNTSLSPVSAANLIVGMANATTLNATAITQDGATLDNLIGSNVDGAISTANKGNNMTASRAIVSDASGKLAPSAVTSTEIGYLDGVSSAIQTQLDAKQATITGSATTIDTESLTADRAVISNGSQKIAVSDVTSTELGYLDGVTSAVQTQIDSKQATITGAATTIDDADLTASRALVSDGSGKVAVSAVTATEVGYLDGVTSAIQTQFTAAETRRTNNIAGAVSTVTTSDLTASRALVAGSGGKIEVSAVTSTELGYLDGVTQAIQSNLAALAAGIAGNVTGALPTGDYGLLDSANIASDAFGEATGSFTTFDMKTTPSGSVATEDLGALS